MSQFMPSNVAGRLVAALTLLFGLALGTGCGGAYQKLPVNQSKTLRNKVAGEFDGVTQSLESVKSSARSLSDVPPDMARTLDMGSLRKAMQACFNAPIKRVKAPAKRTGKNQRTDTNESTVAGCNGNGNPQVAGFNQLPAQSKAFVKAKIELVDSIRQELRHGLPARLARLPKLATSVPLDMLKLMGQAEAKHRVNLMLGGKWAARSTREKKAMDEDFDYIKGSTGRLKDELLRLPKDLAGIGAQVVKDLANFGRQSVSGR